MRRIKKILSLRDNSEISEQKLGSQAGFLLDQTRALSKPVLWLATILEGAAAVASLSTKMPPWILSALLVGIPLAVYSIHLGRMNRQLRNQVIHLYHYDRRYQFFLSRWTMRKSAVMGYWDATLHAERRFTCLRPMRSMRWNINRRSEDDMPFNKHLPQLKGYTATRSGHGLCVFREPHRTGASLTFRVEFDPKLRPGEEVVMQWELDVPVYKPGTIEFLRERPAPQVPPPGEAEFTTTDVTYPIDEFVKEVIIPEKLMSSRHGVQVLRRDNEFVEEEEFLNRTGNFEVLRTDSNGESVWAIRIVRKNPPIKTAYRIYWRPPQEVDVVLHL
jgi:hypothetical protein